MCKHIVYTTIVNFQINIVYRRKIKNRKKKKRKKGNTIATLDKISYISAIEEILNGHTKFSNLDVWADKEINYIANLEKVIISNLKVL